jgi:hypothetical protein
VFEYIKKLFTIGHIYLGLFFFTDRFIYFIFDIHMTLPNVFKYTVISCIVFYATYKVYKNELDEKEKLSSLLNGETIELCEETKELLQGMIKDKSGTLSIFNGNNETIIQTDNINYTEDNTARTIAKYKSALNDLIDYNLVDIINDTHYKVNENGYKYFEK